MGILNRSVKIVLFIITEFAEFCVANSRENSTSNSITRAVWDGGLVETNRRKDAVTASNYLVSIIAHITRHEFEAIVKLKDYYNGLLNRFLFCYVDRSKIEPNPTDIEKVDISVSSAKLAEVFVFLDGYTEASPLVFELTAEANELWNKFYHEHAYGDENPIIDSMGARLPPHAKRIAMIFAVLDKSKVITEKHLQASIDVCEYHASTIRYLFAKDINTLKGFHPKEKKLISFLVSQDEQYASRTEIIKHVFQNNGNAEAWNKLRDQLISDNVISVYERDGKEFWMLTQKHE